jgi:hypothetical protein
MLRSALGAASSDEERFDEIETRLNRVEEVVFTGLSQVAGPRFSQHTHATARPAQARQRCGVGARTRASENRAAA